MRIGLFAPRLAESGAKTGIGRYVRDLVSALSEAARPSEQLVLVSTPEPGNASWVPACVEKRTMSWPRRLVHAAWCLGSGPRLERAVGPLDVVHLLYPFPPIRTAAPQLVTLHDVMPFEHPEWFPRSEPLIYRRSVRLALARATRVVVPSAYVKDRLVSVLDFDATRIDVVPLGVSGAYNGAGASADVSATCVRFGVKPGRFVVCVGAVSARKNLIPVIRAMAELSVPGITLLIVGPDGFDVARTESEIERLDGRVQVRRTGHVPDQEAAALVRSAAALVHPSLEEGFGLPPLEAMAAGTPVIAARVSSVPEVVGAAGVLVDQPTEPTAWAGALSEVLGSEARRAALAAAGQDRAAMFSWQSAASTMLEAYRSVARS